MGDMEQQKVFTNGYVSSLWDAVSKGKLDAYSDIDHFPYDETQFMVAEDLIKPQGLLTQMIDVDSDGEAAKALFRAYSGLTPVQAAYDPFWVYLSHVDLYGFVRRRWPDINTDKNPTNYIKEHWFGKDIMQSLSGWWWSVFFTVSEDKKDFTLTDFLFDHREDLRQNLGTSSLFRHRPFTRALLSFLIENNDITAVSQIPRGRFIIQYFNRIGAIKQLAIMDELFFKTVLNGLKPQIMGIQSIKDLR